MYTYNLYVYGHQMAKNPTLNNELHEFDFEYQKTINGRLYEVHFPYHGGQVAGDIQSCIFGTIITDTDNPDHTDDILSFKENDYKEDYLSFLESVKEALKEDIENEIDEYYYEFKDFVERLIEYLDNTEPKLYAVEASS